MNIEAKSETWRDIKGYHGYYKVSNLGRIKSLERDNRVYKFGRLIPEKILKPQIHYKNGYHSVLFKIKSHQKRFTVHSLVANAFIPNKNCYEEINHKDGNKSNNTVVNLEWTTRQLNCIHANITGLRKRNGKQQELVSINDTSIIEFKSISECAYYIGVSRRTIMRHINTNNDINGKLIFSL